MHKLALLAIALTLATPALAHHGKPHGRCDVNGDGIVTRADLDAIDRAMRTKGRNADGKDDPRDADRDGLVTKHDRKACAAKCTFKSCAAK